MSKPEFTEGEMRVIRAKACRITPMEAMDDRPHACACMGPGPGMQHCRCVINGAAQQIAKEAHIKTHNAENRARDCAACVRRFEGWR